MPRGAGAAEVEAIPDGRGLTVVVRDFGPGIRPRPDVERPSLRIGLTLIAAPSSSFEISGGVERDRRSRCTCRWSPATNVPSPAARARHPGRGSRDEGRLTGAGRPGPRPGLGALAARREITVDRLSDTMLLTDAISARAPRLHGDDHVCLSVSDDDEWDRPRIGPMARGGAERLRAEARAAREWGCWSPSPTSCGSRSATRASTWSCASGDLAVEAGAVLFGHRLLADSLQRAPQDPGDVHLGMADPLGDLRLGHVLDEAQPQDQALALVEVGQGSLEGHLVPRPARSPRPRRRSTRRPGDSSESSPPTGRSRESGRRLWLASAPPARRSVDSSSRRSRPPRASAAAPGQLVDRLLDFGHAVVQPARHPHRPDPVAEMALQLAEDGRRGEGGEGDPALGIEAIDRVDQAEAATWSRSSKDSLAPRYRWVRFFAKGR